MKLKFSKSEASQKMRTTGEVGETSEQCGESFLSMRCYLLKSKRVKMKYMTVTRTGLRNSCDNLAYRDITLNSTKKLK